MLVPSTASRALPTLLIMRLLSLSTVILPFILAQSAQQPIQIYLHPTPTLPVPSHSAPTLSADQAKAVLAHHLGEVIDDFEEIPSDEGLWGHLMGMWRGEKGVGKARVVVIDGGVLPQGKVCFRGMRILRMTLCLDVLPSTLSSSPSFYLHQGSSSRNLLAPYLQRASLLLSHILDAIPSFGKSFKDAFDLAGTSPSHLTAD